MSEDEKSTEKKKIKVAPEPESVVTKGIKPDQKLKSYVEFEKERPKRDRKKAKQ